MAASVDPPAEDVSGVAQERSGGDSRGTIAFRRLGPAGRSGGSLREAAAEQLGRRVSSKTTGSIVLLNVYNLGISGADVLNRILRPLGSGLFHCGVSIHGREWSFSDTVDGKGDGIFWCKPGGCPEHGYAESVKLGYTSASQAETIQLLVEMRPSYAVQDYRTMTKNCITFCEDLCRRLNVDAPPSWVTHLAHAAAKVGSSSGPSPPLRPSGSGSLELCCSPLYAADDAVIMVRHEDEAVPVPDDLRPIRDAVSVS
eukprot:TRINITY_DN2818_c0_g2_i3.p1 TRINITY_DN2818_c0_g2~~TRINITY_DN2818_c0_g2_i3.p1  ORF type:complete len:266 (-),score=45.60 TRINITY_DN2818_c0_g2_i3:1132-1899(-)